MNCWNCLNNVIASECGNPLDDYCSCHRPRRRLLGSISAAIFEDAPRGTTLGAWFEFWDQSKQS